MKSSRDIQKTPSSDPWAMSSNLSSGVHRGDASDQSPVQENRPHGLRRRTSLWKIDKFITLLLHQKRFRECRVLLRCHSDISLEPLLNNYHQLQQWSAIRSSETIRHFSHPPGRNGQGFRVALAKSFVTLGTSMIYRKLKLLRNFKKSIQPNKSWEGQGGRNTVKLSFAWILPLLKTILASAIHQINGLKLVDLFTWYRGRPLRQVLSMRDVFEGQLKQRRVPPVAACLLHMMLPLKSCKF